MAVNRVPILKRCRSLGLDPVYLGIDKKSKRELKRGSRKISEYGLQLREKQKAKFITLSNDEDGVAYAIEKFCFSKS